MSMQSSSPQLGSAATAALALGSSGTAVLESLPFAAVQSVEGLVRQLMASWQKTSPFQQRRRWHRTVFSKRMVLIPLDEATEEPVDDARFVTGKDISLHGISFVHQRTLPYVKVALGLEMPGGVSAQVVTHLKWCRFTRQGVYQSGGQFLRQMETPADGPEICWPDLPPG
jgi:hypothetical protein